MAIRNANYGGTNFISGEIIKSGDFNDTFDASYLPYAPNTVISGLELTGTGAQTVDISEGYFVDSNGKVQHKTAVSGQALSAADGSNPRMDLISIQDDGTITVTDGTPAATASTVLPTTPTGETVLGYVYRATSDNTTSTNDCVNLGVHWSPTQDKICEWHTTSASTTEMFIIPLENGPLTYSKFRLYIQVADASTNITGYMRIQNLAGANDYGKYSFYVTSTTPPTFNFASTTSNICYITLPYNQGSAIFDFTIDSTVGAATENLFGSFSYQKGYESVGNSYPFKQDFYINSNQPSEITFLKFWFSTAADIKMTLYGLK